MRLLLWIIGCTLVLLAEIAVFSNVTFFAGLPLSYAVLLTGITLLPFRGGFWFAGAAGLLRDLVLPADAASATLFAFFLFLGVHAFFRIAAWDEPLRRIAAFAVGVALTPLLAGGATLLTQAFGLGGFSGSALGVIQLSSFVFITFWFFLFTLFSVRAARREQRHALGYL